MTAKQAVIAARKMVTGTGWRSIKFKPGVLVIRAGYIESCGAGNGGYWIGIGEGEKYETYHSVDSFKDCLAKLREVVV